jgi:thiamine kinase-like enzyme
VPAADPTATFDESVRDERRAELLDLLTEFGLAGSAPRVSFLPGGASNENYLVETAEGRYVVRLAGLEVDRFHFDRARGAAAHRSAAASGVSPELVAVRLPDGHSLTRFAEGPILTAEIIRRPGMLETVAGTLRTLHDGEPIDGAWSVFEDVSRYAATAYAEGLVLPDDRDELLERMALVEDAFAAHASPVAMCHNDLQLQNFIVGEEQVWLLDFEFAGMGNRYFDLGNLAVNAELDAGEVAQLVTAYFGAASQVEVTRVQLMMFMAALREATWAVIAEPVLQLDWDYQAWAALYFERSRRAFDDSVAGGFEPARGRRERSTGR